MQRKKKDFDAVVVGSGPNGLAAAITLQQKGLSVLLVEAKSSVSTITKNLILNWLLHNNVLLE